MSLARGWMPLQMRMVTRRETGGGARTLVTFVRAGRLLDFVTARSECWQERRQGVQPQQSRDGSVTLIPTRCRPASSCPSRRRPARTQEPAGAAFSRWTKLRLEECGYEKPVRRRFDGANFALRAARDDGKSGFHRGPFEVGIDFKVAEEFFGHGFFVFPVERLQVRAGAQANLRDRARKLGSVALAVRDGAGDGIDDDVLRSGIVFGAVGVLMSRTLRANSMKAYWNPPQVPRNGQSRRRANSIPFSMPSKLL